MILPILAFGDPVLRKKGELISKDYQELPALIENMWETMYGAEGVGLAAPQIGSSFQLFLVDASPFSEDEPELEGFKKIFINPEILEETGEEWQFKEGCLSIPGIRENVKRQQTIKIRYFDENFIEHIEHFSGLAARVIQHEYDHINGILFTDKINPLKKQMIKRKLTDISKGIVKAGYRMRFPK
ncbi:MAG: peptide deformylase [Flavobacteriales bacterium]|nr:peptide deformylase [Flavobacteriales bacterium]|tara:strand:- start:36 stop:590 length:555 start_codon:yes stop_codon:yes gene_type:complete